MAQSVSQASLLLAVLTGSNKYLAASKSDDDMRFGIVRQWMSTNSEVNSRFEESVALLEKNGIKLIEVELTPPEDQESEDELMVMLYELNEGIYKYLSTRSGARVSTLAEIVAFNNHNSESELKHFGQELFEKALDFENKRNEYLESRKRNLIWAEKTLAHGLQDVDVLIGCTFGPAWESSLLNGDNFESATWISTAPSIAGTPIGTIPMGLVTGLPVGLGFVSARNHESKLITAMGKAERALDLGILQPTFLK
jgi:amidase